MINEKYEVEYNNLLKTWQKAFENLCDYENKLKDSNTSTAYNRVDIDKKYERLLEVENTMHKQLNDVRKKYFLFG